MTLSAKAGSPRQVNAAMEASIITACIRLFDLESEQFFQDARGQHHTIVDARHVAMELLRRDGLSYPSIARTLGLWDHTSAMHGVRRVMRDERLRALADAVWLWFIDWCEKRKAA
jgi:chromosomal replication initiation ATPase DnaA